MMLKDRKSVDVIEGLMRRENLVPPAHRATQDDDCFHPGLRRFHGRGNGDRGVAYLMQDTSIFQVPDAFLKKGPRKDIAVWEPGVGRGDTYHPCFELPETRNSRGLPLAPLRAPRANVFRA